MCCDLPSGLHVLICANVRGEDTVAKSAVSHCLEDQSGIFRVTFNVALDHVSMSAAWASDCSMLEFSGEEFKVVEFLVILCMASFELRPQTCSTADHSGLSGIAHCVVCKSCPWVFL